MKKLLFAGVTAAVMTLAGSYARAADSANMGGSMGQHDPSMAGQHDPSMAGQHDPSMAQTDTAAAASGLNGTVTNIDKKKSLVTLQVQLAPGASIMKDGRATTIDQLKKGDDVRASFDPATNAITQINVSPKGTMDHMNKDSMDHMNK
jgi:hypothetical protein